MHYPGSEGHKPNQFDSHLDNNPADWATRLVYSDWLEDEGRVEEAKFQRWLVAVKRHPWESRAKVSGTASPSVVRYQWWFFTAQLGESYISAHENRYVACINGLVGGERDDKRVIMDTWYGTLFGKTRADCEAKLLKKIMVAVPNWWESLDVGAMLEKAYVSRVEG